jgi:membrane-associated HD superfamily phosphohydrolase
MWRILELIVVIAVILISITEFFYPLIAGKPFFGSFRRTKKTMATEPGSLDDKVNQAKEKVEEIKKVQNEVDSNYRSAEQLKKESDDLLNKPKL